jgi:hypothetical protein
MLVKAETRATAILAKDSLDFPSGFLPGKILLEYNLYLGWKKK